MIVKNIATRYLRSAVRVEATVVDKKGIQKDLYFLVSGVDKKFIRAEADAFIPALLPSAMSQEEDLKIDGSVSPRILVGQQKFQNKIVQWQKRLHKVRVTAKAIGTSVRYGNRDGLFFSGGVDSFYTFLKNKRSGITKITDFILVWGFDIPLSDIEFFGLVRKRIKTVAREFGVNLIIVETNLTQLSSGYVDWKWQVGGSLAAIALILKNYFRSVHIASATSKEDTAPFGSHPELDPLWSTQHLKIIHEANGCSRLERVHKYVAKSPIALNNLRVCWKRVKSSYNCGKCEKCLRTMMELELVGVLSKAKTFKQPLDLERVSKTILSSSDITFSEEILRVLRRRKENKPLQEALVKQLSISMRPSIRYKIRQYIHSKDHKFNNDRLFWYLSARGVI